MEHTSRRELAREPRFGPRFSGGEGQPVAAQERLHRGSENPSYIAGLVKAKRMEHTSRRELAREMNTDRHGRARTNTTGRHARTEVLDRGFGPRFWTEVLDRGFGGEGQPVAAQERLRRGSEKLSVRGEGAMAVGAMAGTGPMGWQGDMKGAKRRGGAASNAGATQASGVPRVRGDGVERWGGAASNAGATQASGVPRVRGDGVERWGGAASNAGATQASGVPRVRGDGQRPEGDSHIAGLVKAKRMEHTSRRELAREPRFGPRFWRGGTTGRRSRAASSRFGEPLPHCRAFRGEAHGTYLTKGVGKGTEVSTEVLGVAASLTGGADSSTIVTLRHGHALPGRGRQTFKEKYCHARFAS